MNASAEKKRGAVLVYVILILALLSVLGAGVLMLANHSSRQTAQEADAEQAYLSAKSSLASLMRMMENDTAAANAAAAGLTAAGRRTAAQQLSVNNSSLGELTADLSCVSGDEPCTVIRIDASVAYGDAVKTATGYLKHSQIDQPYADSSDYQGKGNYVPVSLVKESGSSAASLTIQNFNGTLASDLSQYRLSAAQKADLNQHLFVPLADIRQRQENSVCAVDADGGQVEISGTGVYLNGSLVKDSTGLTCVIVSHAGSLNVTAAGTSANPLLLLCLDQAVDMDLVIQNNAVYYGWIVAPDCRITMRVNGTMTIHGGLVCGSLGCLKKKNALVIDGSSPLEVWQGSYENPTED